MPSTLDNLYSLPYRLRDVGRTAICDRLKVLCGTTYSLQNSPRNDAIEGLSMVNECERVFPLPQRVPAGGVLPRSTFRWKVIGTPMLAAHVLKHSDLTHH